MFWEADVLVPLLYEVWYIVIVRDYLGPAYYTNIHFDYAC